MKRERPQQQQQQQEQQKLGLPYEELSEDELRRRREDGGESSDEEQRNTVGDVPMEWYADSDHIGYDRDGHRITKAAGWERRRDAIETFLDAKDDPDHWRRFYDAREDVERTLSDADLRIVGALLSSRFAAARALPPGGEDPDWPLMPVDEQQAAMPTGLDVIRKRDFVPTTTAERREIMRLARLISKGWIKPPSAEKEEEQPDAGEFAVAARYDLWALPGKGRPGNLPPPPARPPGHEESYNPPAEYLPTDEEVEKLEAEHQFVPRKYASLRMVPGFSGLLKHMYRRCLEIYLRPRRTPELPEHKEARLKRDELLEGEQAKMPSPEELKPFPTSVAVIYRGHGDGAMVRCVAPDITGQWLASGADDGGFRLWEVETGRCVAVATFGNELAVRCVAWRPVVVRSKPKVEHEGEDESAEAEEEEEEIQENRALAIAAGPKVFIVEPRVLIGDAANEEETHDEPIESDTTAAPGVTWRKATAEEKTLLEAVGKVNIVIEHEDDVAALSWHRGADYLLVVTQRDVAQPVRDTHVFVHRVSTFSSRRLHMTTRAGPVQTASFDPSGKPLVFIATQRNVRVYNVGPKKKKKGTKRQSSLVKKLLPRVRWVSTVAVHPTGRHAIIGSFDKRVCWFDMELSTQPFKTMRHHRMAVRRVAFHPLAGSTLPLFASCSDDGRTHIFHASIPAENDWNADPLLVPLRILHGHSSSEGYGVLDVAFHPTQPWVFTAGADGLVVLHTDKDILAVAH